MAGFGRAVFSFALVIAARMVSAQSIDLGPQVYWTPLRAPDSTFAILLPYKHPADIRHAVVGTVMETSYSSELAGTRIVVREQVLVPGENFTLAPRVDNFCATCLGNVVADSTLMVAPFDGRWIRIENGRENPATWVTGLYRVVSDGTRLFVIGALSQPGGSLAPEAGWFLESFKLCRKQPPCEPFNETAPVYKAPIFHFFDEWRDTDRPTMTMQQVPPFFPHIIPVPVEPDSPWPEYPAELKGQGIVGDVLATFDVDRNGKVRMETLKILTTTLRSFSEAVKVGLPKMRFKSDFTMSEHSLRVTEQRFVFKEKP